MTSRSSMTPGAPPRMPRPSTIRSTARRPSISMRARTSACGSGCSTRLQTRSSRSTRNALKWTFERLMGSRLSHLRLAPAGSCSVPVIAPISLWTAPSPPAKPLRFRSKGQARRHRWPASSVTMAMQPGPRHVGCKRRCRRTASRNARTARRGPLRRRHRPCRCTERPAALHRQTRPNCRPGALKSHTSKPVYPRAWP